MIQFGLLPLAGHPKSSSSPHPSSAGHPLTHPIDSIRYSISYSFFFVLILICNCINPSNLFLIFFSLIFPMQFCDRATFSQRYEVKFAIFVIIKAAPPPTLLWLVSPLRQLDYQPDPTGFPSSRLFPSLLSIASHRSLTYWLWWQVNCADTQQPIRPTIDWTRLQRRFREEPQWSKQGW